jgi:hypothetical protein
MPLPERLHDRKVVALLIGAVVLVIPLGVWFLVSVLAPTVENLPCDGVQFRAPVQTTGVSKAGTPPIGSGAGFGGKVRALFNPGEPVVYCHDFADPFVLRNGDSYYAYSTNTENDHVPVLTAGGLFSAGSRHDVLPKLPAWSATGFVWAPSLLPRPDGYVLYYTTLNTATKQECISYALGKEPGGPFVDTSTGPFICPTGGGAIDPEPFIDPSGRVFLLWKNYDGQTGIMGQELSADGLQLIGAPVLMAQADQTWEAGIVEAPTMLESGGQYFLFYSGNDWDTANYAIGYAVCSSPLGPCTKPNNAPWLTGTPTAQGPGSPSVFTDDKGNTWLALHSWVGDKVGYPGGARNLFVVRFTIVNGAPALT